MVSFHCRSVSYICSVVVFYIEYSFAQFPAVCVSNATRPNATCCPTPPGFTEPCGGHNRGRCVQLHPTDDLRNVPEPNRLDDRFSWPTRFFQFACDCTGNFSGYMCHECWYGNAGPDCNQPIKIVRKDIRTLSAAEKQRFVSLLEQSMEVQSDYMVMNTTRGMDPAIDPQFLNVSVFQYLSYIHYYVARKTNFANETMCDDVGPMWPDFAHGGSAFPLWHRLFSLKWERALQQIAGDETFALPYWNWTDAGSSCDVCTDDLLGATNLSDPVGRLSPESAFSSWRIMCHPPTNGCHVCDPYVDNGPIIRRPGANPLYRNLPTKGSVDYALSLTFYDLEPYSVHSPNTAFRNVLEGYADADGPSIGNSSVHNLIHSFLNGTMSRLATAAMDPIFLVHHTFVDKLFEVWLRDNHATARRLPLVGAQPGHNRNSYLVPFFPLQPAFQFFQTNHKLGYVYDDMESGNTDDNKGSMFLEASWIMVIVAGCVIVALATALVLLIFRRSNQGSASTTHPKMPSTATGQVTDEETQPIMGRDSYTDNKSYDTYGPIG